MDELSPSLEAEVSSFGRYLTYRNRSAKTIRIYTLAATKLAEHVTAARGVTDWAQVTRRDIEEFITTVLAANSAAYASNQYRALQQFFKWYAEEEETPDPMAGMSAPQVPEQPVPVLREEQIKALLKSCQGKGFLARRDAAILYLFCDSGVRLAELTGLRLADVDLDHREVTVLGKNRRTRTVPFGRRAGYALDRYLSVRARHRWADDEALWLADRGRGGRAMTDSGIYQMIRRRGAEIGIPELYPHMLRHSWAHHARLGDHLRDDELMSLAGWRSRQMLLRYGVSAADERARQAGKRSSLGDRL